MHNRHEQNQLMQSECVEDKRFFSRALLQCFLALTLVFALFPTQAFAEEGSEEAIVQTDPDIFVSEPSYEAEYAEGELIVAFKEPVPEAEAISTFSTQSTEDDLSTLCETVETIGEESDQEQTVLRVELEEDVTVEEAIAQFEQDPSVEYAQPNYVFRMSEGVEISNEEFFSEDDADASTDEEVVVEEFTTYEEFQSEVYGYEVEDEEGGFTVQATSVNDPFAKITVNKPNSPNQWWLKSVNLPDAWSVARSNKKVTIAVLDTGINFSHVDLRGNINTGLAYDAVTKKKLTASPTDQRMAHGTHVAGITAAQANNGTQFAGASYNASILPINVFYYDKTAKGYVTNTVVLLEAFKYLSKQMTAGNLTNLHVINMSLGAYYTPTKNDILQMQIKSMVAKNVLTVCSAGNDATSKASYPSDFPESMSVIALDSYNNPAVFTNYGPNKNIAAPGVNIWSTWIGGNSSNSLNGTSMAAPVVSGIAAMMWAYNPKLSVDDVKSIIYSTATDYGATGFDYSYGWGKVNAAAAVRAVRDGGSSVTVGSANVLAGDNRYGTMSRSVESFLAQKATNGGTVNTVIVASGQQFPDALAASALAGSKGAPIILSEPNRLPTEAITLLKKINPGKVIVVGGSSAISNGVVGGIKNLTNAKITRVSGSNRIETGIKIYDAGKSSWGKTAIVSSSASFADSLSISPYAYKMKSPIFLVDPQAGKLTSEALKRLTSGGFTQVIVVGGTAAVPASVVNQMKSKNLKVVRWQGSNRYETSQVIARNSVASGVLKSTTTGVATGEVFADALSAGPLLGLKGSPLVLMANSSAGKGANTGFLVEQRGNIRRMIFFGGDSALPQSVRYSAQRAAGINLAG